VRAEAVGFLLELGISQSTVEAHRARVMEKMQADTLSELMQRLSANRPAYN